MEPLFEHFDRKNNIWKQNVLKESVVYTIPKLNDKECEFTRIKQ